MLYFLTLAQAICRKFVLFYELTNGVITVMEINLSFIILLQHREALYFEETALDLNTFGIMLQ